jgi:GT2 family glycosyltransferase
MGPLSLSIVIISYNARKLLRDCINSVKENVRDLDYEIIVVDNASGDGSAEMVESEYKKIRLIRNAENAGFSKANNQAIKIASGKYIALLNSDTLIKKTVMETLVNFMEMHAGVAAAGPTILNFDGTLQSIGMGFPNVIDTVLHIMRIDRILHWIRSTKFRYKKPFAPFKVDCVSGCCILLRKQVIEKIGDLSEDFEFYFEETEWCYRAEKRGYETWCVPSVEIYHLGSGSKKLEAAKAFVKSESIWYIKANKNLQGFIVILIRLIDSIFKILLSMFLLRRKLFQRKTALCKHMLIVMNTLTSSTKRC